jgi:hypothetical protein
MRLLLPDIAPHHRQQHREAGRDGQEERERVGTKTLAPGWPRCRRTRR